MHAADEVVMLLGGGCLWPLTRQRCGLAPVPYLVIRCGCAKSRHSAASRPTSKLNISSIYIYIYIYIYQFESLVCAEVGAIAVLKGISLLSRLSIHRSNSQGAHKLGNFYLCWAVNRVFLSELAWDA